MPEEIYEHGRHPNSLKNLIPAKQGDVRNPAGRKTIGASIREHANSLGAKMDSGKLGVKGLRRILARHKNPLRRAAALRVLRMLENGDLADFAGLLKGENSLEDLRGMGVNTEVVKKFKQKTRKVQVGDGEVEEVIEREIELHDRSGIDFDRVVEHTDGKANQAIQVQGEIGLPIPVIIVQMAHPTVAKQLAMIDAAKPLPEG